MINTIVFDFGDVFINLDKGATVREITKSFGQFTISDAIIATNEAYEKGEISSENFVAFYSNHFETDKPEILKKAWNAIILDFPEHRLRFIEALASSKKYELLLLSNTNALHIEQVIKNMHPSRYNRFKNCFNAFYLSHEIGLRKPNANIYEFVMQTHKLTPNQVLFIDDTPENTEAATKLGIHVWNLNPKIQDITNLFTIKKELF